jgi:hypothetical protein
MNRFNLSLALLTLAATVGAVSTTGCSAPADPSNSSDEGLSATTDSRLFSALSQSWDEGGAFRMPHVAESALRPNEKAAEREIIAAHGRADLLKFTSGGASAVVVACQGSDDDSVDIRVFNASDKLIGTGTAPSSAEPIDWAAGGAAGSSATTARQAPVCRTADDCQSAFDSGAWHLSSRSVDECVQNHDKPFYCMACTGGRCKFHAGF